MSHLRVSVARTVRVLPIEAVVRSSGRCFAVAALVAALFAPIRAHAGRGDDRGGTLVFPPFGHSYGIRKAEPKHLFMFFGPRTFFDDPQGLATVRLAVWDDTSTCGDDDEVVVYGVNSGRHQIIYNTSMWTLSIYGKKGDGEGCFFYPKGIAADASGNVYVADSGNNRVVRLFNPKSRLQWVLAFDGAPHGVRLSGPSRIALDEDGIVYVNDTGNRRIVAFDSTGNVLKVLPLSGGAATALAIADSRHFWSFFGNERTLFYADSGGRRLVRSSLDGKTLGTASLPQGYAACYGAVDFYHNYWITDRNRHCVLKFDHELRLLDIFGSFGRGDHEFDAPAGITIYKRFGQVFIAERTGAQYYWIGTDCQSASIDTATSAGRCALSLDATEYSFVSLFTVAGRDTAFFLRRRRARPGGCRIPVDGACLNLPAGALTLRLEPTYSSYTYSVWDFALPFAPVPAEESRRKGK